MSPGVELTGHTSLTRVARFSCFGVLAICAAVVFGTAAEFPRLANPFGGMTMKANTALILALFAIALLLELSTRRWTRAAKGFHAVAGAASLVTFLQYVLNVRFGIDELIVPDRISVVGSLPAGRMAPTTGFALLALGVGGLWPERVARGSIWCPRQGLALVAAAAGFASLTDLLFVTDLPSALYRQMALTTALCLMLLSFSMLTTRPESVLMRVFVGELLGARLARQLMPAVFVTPVILGWLRLEGERRGLYDTGYGVALMVVATTVLLGVLVVAGAESINRADRERRLYIAQLQGAQSDLRQANAFLDAVFENLPTMVFVKEAKRLTFTRLNRKAEEIIGVPRSKLLGLGDKDFFPAEQAAFFESKDREALNRGELVDITEEQLRTATGTRWLHTKKVPIRDDDGTPLFLLGISEDITDQKLRAEELRSAKDVAESNSRELEAFSYSVSHDLRAPLRSIDGFSQALLEDCFDQLGPDGQDSLKRIRANAQRMGELIDDLLALSKVTRAELRTEACDVTLVARETGETLRQQQPGREVVFEVEEGLRAVADPRLLRTVFENLLGNAWKFSSRKGQAKVSVARGPVENGKVTVCVRDNGAGFDQKYANKLFGAFQRLHAMKDFEGTGIGLATVQRIIHRHGGRVWAEGIVGEGASFYFSLPEATAAPRTT